MGAASSLEQANGYQFPANDHVMAIMAYSAVPKPKKVDHVMEILKLEHEAVRLAKKVDHLMEILKLEHAAAVRDVDFVKKIRKMSTHKKKVDHVMEILSFEHAAATRLGKRVDHLMEILKLEYREPEINQLAQAARNMHKLYK